MDSRLVDRLGSLQAYPTIRVAAEFLGVSPSTLSRRSDLEAQPRGERDQVLRPTRVLELASVYRRRSLNDVAHDLVELAMKVSPAEATQVKEEVEAFFDARQVTDEARIDFLTVARELLPPQLYRQVETAIRRRTPAAADSVLGYYPAPRS
jgi:hypothetical protein